MPLSTCHDVCSKCMTENKHGNATETSANELPGGLVWNREKETEHRQEHGLRGKITRVKKDYRSSSELSSDLFYVYASYNTYFAPQHNENISRRQRNRQESLRNF